MIRASAVSKGGPSTVKVSSAGATATGAFTIWSLASATPTTARTPSPTSTPSLAITTTSLPSGDEANTVAQPYSATLAATGGTKPYKWSIAKGSSLPPGLTLYSSGLFAGVITGTPTTAGTFPFEVEVTDSTSPTPETATAPLSIPVASVYQNTFQAGYNDDLTQVSSTYFHFAEAIYTEATGSTSSCGTGTTEATWVGLGEGDLGSNGAWAQAGTTIGQYRNDLKPNQAWVLLFGPGNYAGQVHPEPIYATPGQKFEVIVRRTSNQTSDQWSFFFDNLYTGKHLDVSYSGVADADGVSTVPSGFSTAQFVVERPAVGGLLENFGTLNFDSVGVSEQAEPTEIKPITDFHFQEFQMDQQPTGEKLEQIASTGPLTNGGSSFSVTQDRCAYNKGH